MSSILKFDNSDMSLDQVILDTLSEQKEISSLSFASENGLDHQKLVGAIKSLLALPTEYIKVSLFSTTMKNLLLYTTLTAEVCFMYLFLLLKIRKCIDRIISTLQFLKGNFNCAQLCLQD